eukprot:2614869-Prymnesium_polylepis.1
MRRSRRPFSLLTEETEGALTHCKAAWPKHFCRDPKLLLEPVLRLVEDCGGCGACARAAVCRPSIEG